MRIGITIMGSPDAAGSLIKLMRKSVASDFARSKLRFDVVAPKDDLIEDSVVSSTDPIDNFYEASGIAEEMQRESLNDLHAYVFAASVTIQGFDTDGEIEVPLVVVAVAHEGGVGSVRAEPIFDVSQLPPVAATKLRGKLDEINSQMRPRSKDPRNEDANRLCTAIIRPVSCLKRQP